MRPAHERVNAPPFLGKISNRHFFKKTLIFALDFSAGWDYIITITHRLLNRSIVDSINNRRKSSHRENELLIFGLLISRLFRYERLLR